MQKRKGGQPQNRNAAKGQYSRRVVSLSGAEFDAAMRRLEEQGKSNPSDKEIIKEMSALDWSQFGIREETTEEAAQYGRVQAEKSALAEVRADYQWTEECKSMSIETLRKIIADGPYVPNEDGTQPRPEEVNEPFKSLHLKRHMQAQVVLESKVRKDNIMLEHRLYIFDVHGTLTVTKSGATFPKSADDWQWLPGRLAKLRMLRLSRIKLAIATNQGGVAFGYLDPADMRAELSKMAEEAHIALVTMCFSHPNATIEQFKEDSARRKPGPGMLLECIKMSGESKEDCIMIGDHEEDKEAAKAAGIDFEWSDEFLS